LVDNSPDLFEREFLVPFGCTGRKPHPAVAAIIIAPVRYIQFTGKRQARHDSYTLCR
jgi:hypothetical protein